MCVLLKGMFDRATVGECAQLRHHGSIQSNVQGHQLEQHTMTHDIPIGLLTEQRRNITAMLRGALYSYSPLKWGAGRPGETLVQHVPAASEALLNHYVAWSGGDRTRYANSLPPHFLSSQLALSLVSALTAQSPYPMLSVLNQGLRLRIRAPLPRGTDLVMRGRLIDASDDSYRARIHSRIKIGIDGEEPAVVLDAMAAVMLRKRPANEARTTREPLVFETVGHWQADEADGRRFFMLTGDFNPIHTWPLFARRTRYRGCIMHGYGQFAQTFECLQRAGLEPSDIDVRFINPLPLPSPELMIQVTAMPDAMDDRRRLRVLDASGKLYLAGTFVLASDALTSNSLTTAPLL